MTRSVTVNDPEYIEAVKQAAISRAHFLETKKFKTYQLSESNMLKVLKTGGASTEECRKVVTLINGSRRSDFFDHADIFGRDGKPLMLVCCPYGLSVESNIEIFTMLINIGMKIRVHVYSIYGFGTVQVEISAKNSN